jgi:hypothetical protein
MAAMNIPFFRIPVPEVLEREIDQNIAACNAEVEHLISSAPLTSRPSMASGRKA